MFYCFSRIDNKRCIHVSLSFFVLTESSLHLKFYQYYYHHIVVIFPNEAEKSSIEGIIKERTRVLEGLPQRVTEEASVEKTNICLFRFHNLVCP